MIFKYTTGLYACFKNLHMVRLGGNSRFSFPGEESRPNVIDQGVLFDTRTRIEIEMCLPKNVTMNQ